MAGVEDPLLAAFGTEPAPVWPRASACGNRGAADGAPHSPRTCGAEHPLLVVAEPGPMRAHQAGAAGAPASGGVTAGAHVRQVQCPAAPPAARSGPTADSAWRASSLAAFAGDPSAVPAGVATHGGLPAHEAARQGGHQRHIAQRRTRSEPGPARCSRCQTDTLDPPAGAGLSRGWSRLAAAHESLLD